MEVATESAGVEVAVAISTISGTAGVEEADRVPKSDLGAAPESDLEDKRALSSVSVTQVSPMQTLSVNLPVAAVMVFATNMRPDVDSNR